MKSAQISALANTYKSRLEDFPPYEKNSALYFRRTDNNQEILYLKATCDELRHGLTNYEKLLDEIKKLNFDNASAKEAVIYAIKYEATRKVYHTQRKWIKKYYDSLIVNIKEHKTLQEAKEENDELQIKITSLEKLRDTLLAQVKQKDEEIQDLQQQVNKYIKLWQQYEKKLEAEKARREQLGKNNKSLGAYKGLYNQEKKKTEILKQEIKLLKDKIKTIEQQLEIQ
jgi:chromosome segregation ATPase